MSNLNNRVSKLEQSQKPDEPSLYKSWVTAWSAPVLAKIYDGIDIDQPELPEGWKDDPMVQKYLRDVEKAYGEKTE
jgi:hypothetical protein